MADLSGISTEQLAYGLAEALDRASHAQWQVTQAEQAAGEFRAELGRRLSVGEVVVVDEETMVVMEAPKPQGRRSVDRAAIHHFIETLGPLGLGPQEDPRPREPRYPTLMELERRAHVLEDHGVPLRYLIVEPPMGAPEVVVKARKAEVAS